jgi:mono/diheme cytochrome c family protein
MPSTRIATAREDVMVRVFGKLVGTALILLPGLAVAVKLGDPKLGLAYARKNCAECHRVEPGGAVSRSIIIPSFESIANKPGITALALNVWMQTPHPTMPNLIVPAEERDNLISYIMSLRAPR